MPQENRDAQTIWRSARRHALGEGTAVDWGQAETLLEDAASAALAIGNPDYAFQLGRIYATGIYYSNFEDQVGQPLCPEIPADKRKGCQLVQACSRWWPQLGGAMVYSGWRRTWDKELQGAISKAAKHHGFFETQHIVKSSGTPIDYPVVLGRTDEGGLAVTRISIRDGVTYVQFDSDGDLDRRLQFAKAVFGLSKAQTRVAHLIALGEGPKSLAQTLGISVNTVRTHLSRLYEKTGVSTQAAILRSPSATMFSCCRILAARPGKHATRWDFGLWIIWTCFLPENHQKTGFEQWSCS